MSLTTPEEHDRIEAKLTSRDERRTARERKREEALQLYLASDGAVSISTLAKRLGVSRDAIMRWKKKYKWDEKLGNIRHERDKMTAEKLAGKLAEEYTVAAEDIVNSYKAVRAIIKSKFSAKAPDGTPLRSADGSLMLNTDMSPREIRDITATLDSIGKSLRLLTGQSTDNQNVNVSGVIGHSYCATGDVIQQAVERALQPGGMEEQQKLAQMLTLFQEMKALTTLPQGSPS